MEGRITSSKEKNSGLHIEFSDDINTKDISPEQLQEYEFDQLFVLFLDYPTVNESVIKAMQNARLDLDDIVSTKHLPRMLELLRAEKHVSISDKVEADISNVTEACKRS